MGAQYAKYPANTKHDGQNTNNDGPLQQLLQFRIFHFLVVPVTEHRYQDDDEHHSVKDVDDSKRSNDSDV